VERAVAHVAELQALAELRQSLRARLQRSPLMDMRTFTRNLETAYRMFWRTWCEMP
jgi:predicted O-linked N-acetylglucosamine transferase (SPINDLY family)